MPLKLTPPQPFEVGQAQLRDNLIKMATQMLQKFPLQPGQTITSGPNTDSQFLSRTPAADAQRLVDTRMGGNLLEAPLGIGERLVGALSKGGQFVRGLMGEGPNKTFDPLQAFALGPVAMPESLVTRFTPKSLGGGGAWEDVMKTLNLSGRGLGEVEREVVEGQGLINLFTLNKEGLPKSFENLSPLEMEEGLKKILKNHMEEVAREEAAKVGKTIDVQSVGELGDEAGVGSGATAITEGLNPSDIGRQLRDINLSADMPSASPSTTNFSDTAKQDVFASNAQKNLAKRLLLQNQGQSAGKPEIHVLEHMGYNRQKGPKSIEAGKRLYARTQKAIASAQDAGMIDPLAGKPSVQLRGVLDKLGLNTEQAGQKITELLQASKDPSIRNWSLQAQAYLLKGKNPNAIARDFGYLQGKERDYFLRKLESITKTVFKGFGTPR
jgi:hypothetical protein